jgi:outer membrane protein TolC
MHTHWGTPARSWTIALILVLAAMPAPIVGQGGSDTLRLATALELARQTNPALQAVRLRADASAEAISPSGALPNPQLSFGFMNRPLDFGTDQMMTMNSVQLVQRFPWPGKLGFAEDEARLRAAADSMDAQDAEAHLLSRVKSVYYQLAFTDRALGIMGETRDLLRDFHQVSTAMYGVGTGLQQDVLQAQVAIASMREDITVMEQNRVGMAARLNSLLGRWATVAVAALELPEPGAPLPSVDSLMQLAALGSPALQAAAARVDAAHAGYRAARRTVYPDFTVTLAYGQRPQFDDLTTIAVGVSIPLFAGSNQLPQRRSREAAEAMQQALSTDLYNETYAQLVELAAQAQRAQAAVESALSAYRVGQVDYMTLLQNEMTVNRYQIEQVRLVAQYHQSVAQVQALVGVELGGSR